MKLRTRIALTFASRRDNRSFAYMLGTWRNTHPSVCS